MNYAKEMQLKGLLRRALKEDVGRKDITTETVIPKNSRVVAALLVKEDCVVCGLDVARLVFKSKDRRIHFRSLSKDGRKVKKGKVLALIFGRAKSILTAERTALNFLSLLSGIATRTREYVERVKHYKVRIMDTRKTIPGLRGLEKYAVRTAGGYNHRLKLDEMVLIKDNHLAVACAVRPHSLKLRRTLLRSLGEEGRSVSCVKEVVRRVKEKKQENIKLEVEVKNLREFKEVLKENPDIIMLDNMNLNDIRKAVSIRNTQYATGHPLIEASGGITLQNIKEVASAGVDMISVGELTHSVKSIDISLEISS